ncbi:MAG: succinate dehydrogenase cytochrome b subunit [Bacteroidota bacterium]
MSGFLKSSVGQKFLMSITGLFLIVFLAVHLTANLFLLVGSDAFNTVSHFMETNPLIQIMQPILALGFIIHMIYAAILTLQNQKARPQSYNKFEQGHSSTWASRNMFVLGAVIFIFLVIHIMNFFWKMKVSGSDLLAEVNVDGEMMHNSYALVAGLFTDADFGIVYSIFYVLGAVFLGLHLHHAFWSALQTLGWSNNAWRKRLEIIGDIYAIIIAAGFSIIPLYFLIFMN